MSSSTPRIVAAAAALLACGAAAAQAQDAPPGPAIRLAVVDMDRVMSDSDMGRAEQASIDKLRNERTAVIASKQKELEELEESIRNASLSWSDERREARVREYETRRIELRRLNEDATRDVQNEFNRALAKLQRAALQVTNVLGREQGYTVILEKKTMPVLFASDAIDITDAVLQRINTLPQEPPGSAPSPGGAR
jgi:outer membrane protein